ncbi:5,6-dimethylbenzimidazole synthase [Granulicella tundricola]|uniref:Cob(II)yrinic acid a,c-diamide reductase n=1 Tax=Granulicella tundricola (strain ATCC BAA-1859 / DSM 23138 / MP5ACTX9) TaxID=1198114 RepID=E8WWI0_GRATM|nr:5,6-dimethylbenzimidazole synthase [Granulicella tundricola]ADW69644.1 cob(II)yrinic acid a,c-diamide reductase [Granulicella tundricola MP5ACTX9]
MDFSADERGAVYRAIAERRDVRRGFLPEAVPDEVMMRVLGAAHAAPSVGLMQPSRFVVVRDVAVRTAVREAFLAANASAKEAYEGERRELYDGLKLEGILEAPQNVCVLCDACSDQGHGLGRQTMPEAAIYSTVCAVQNLWLAGRVEGIGVGWVSILDMAKLREILGVPERLTVVAYLCVGYVGEFGRGPELERVGWESRRGLEGAVSFDRCGAEWG